MQSKTCPACKTDKPLAEFPRDAGKANGHKSRCRRCVTDKWLLTHSPLREKYIKDGLPEARIQPRGWHLRNRPAGPHKRRAYSRQPIENMAHGQLWGIRNPEKRAAHKAVEHALLRGALTPQPCERCGDAVGVHAHHDDYSRPLDVMWLCPKHHAARHRELRAAQKKEAA